LNVAQMLPSGVAPENRFQLISKYYTLWYVFFMTAEYKTLFATDNGFLCIADAAIKVNSSAIVCGDRILITVKLGPRVSFSNSFYRMSETYVASLMNGEIDQIAVDGKPGLRVLLCTSLTKL
jgi:hypothetical protein